MNISTAHIKNIALIFVGEIHRDPAPVSLTRLCIEKLHQQGVPQVFCEELAADQSLELKISNESKCAEQNDILRQVPQIKNLATNSSALALPYYTLHSKNKIQQEMLNHFPNLSDHAAKQAAETLTRYLSFQETIKLNATIQALQIPFQGIELTEKERSALYHVSSEEEYFSWEIKRTQAMIKNLFEKALPHLETTGGLIWVKQGALHTQGLAILAAEQIKVRQLQKDYSFTILPLFCASAYVENTKDFLQEQMPQALQALKRPDLKPLWDKYMCQQIFDIKELKKHCYASAKFEQIVDYAFRSNQRRHVFSIPDLDEHKKELIQSLNGKILEQGLEMAKVCINSELLLASVREELSIDRKSVLLRKKAAEITSLLLQQPWVTVESQLDPQRLLITFPKAQLATITAFIT